MYVIDNIIIDSLLIKKKLQAMKTHLLPLFFFTVFFASLSGQEDEKWAIRNMYFNVGIHTLDVKAFNESLSPYGLGSFNDFSPSISFGMSAIRNKWVWGVDILGFVGNRLVSTEFRSDITTADLSLKGGYILLQSPSWLLYPTVGVGIGSSTLKVEERNPLFNTFLDVLQFRSASITNYYVPFTIAIHSDFLFGSRASKYMVGFSFGYIFTANSKFWGHEELIGGFNNRNSIRDIAPYGPEGLFFQIRIGLSTRFNTQRN